MMARRIFTWPHLIPLLTALAILSLALSTIAVMGFASEQGKRERERVAVDLAGCERGNDLREDIKTLGRAAENLPREMLEIFAAQDPNPNANAETQALVQPAYDRFEEAIDAIKTIDCLEVINGSVPAKE